jgi:hypothetical protein
MPYSVMKQGFLKMFSSGMFYTTESLSGLDIPSFDDSINDYMIESRFRLGLDSVEEAITPIYYDLVRDLVKRL